MCFFLILLLSTFSRNVKQHDRKNPGKTHLRAENQSNKTLSLFYDKNKDRFAIEMEKFVAAVQGKGKVAATGEEGVMAMKLLDAIYKSGDPDREVEV